MIENEQVLEAPVEEGQQEAPVDNQEAPVQPESVQQPNNTELSRITQLAEAAIRREQRLQAELDAMRMSQVPQAPAAPTNEDFANDPWSALQRLVQTEVAPLKEYTAQQRRQSEFNSTFNNYLSTVPALAPYADTIRTQLSQTLLSSNTPINQSVIDVHTKALIGDMMLRQASFAPTSNVPVTPAPNATPANPGTPKPPARKSDVQLTESDLRVKKQLDPDGKIWPTNQAFLDYLSQDTREVPGV